MEAIPLIDLAAPYQAYKDEITEAIETVFSTTRFIGGPALAAFETQLSNYIQGHAKQETQGIHAIACSSGTDALLLALMALGVKSGDEVITTPYSFIATAEVIPMLGAIPVFVDVDERSYMLSPSLVEEKISAKTKAVLPASLFGAPADIDEIAKICQPRGLAILEDAAQSFGAFYKGRVSASLGDISTTSFYPTKSLAAYGDAGAVFTRDALQAKRIRSLLNHGQEGTYFHTEIGMNARMDALQAAILSVKLRHYDEELKRRRAIAKRYQTELHASPYAVQEIHPQAVSVYSQFSLTAKTEEKRKKTLAQLEQAKIGYGMFYPLPLHLQKAFAHLKHGPGDFPIAESLSKRMFSIPVHAFLQDTQVTRIIEVLRGVS